MAKKRKHKRMAKKDRQNQKLWAEGCREDILAPHIEPYADALKRSYVAERDYMRRIQNEYHQLIPWDLPDDEEPLLPLPEYDPHLQAVEEELTAEEAECKSKTIAKKNKVHLAPSYSHVLLMYFSRLFGTPRCSIYPYDLALAMKIVTSPMALAMPVATPI